MSGQGGFGFVPTAFGSPFDPSSQDASASAPFAASSFPSSSSSLPFGVPSSSSPFGGGAMGASPLAGDEDDYENEPPLLEELGKTVAVLNPLKRDLDADQLDDADLAGPFVFALLLGATLLLRGKWTFDYIYGFGAVGSLAMYFLVNVMGHDDRAEVSMYKTLSVLGYCLLPMVLPALLSLALPLTGLVGGSFALLSVLWCTASATYLFTSQHMTAQRLLVAYPLFLFYACFALLTVF